MESLEKCREKGQQNIAVIKGSVFRGEIYSKYMK